MATDGSKSSRTERGFVMVEGEPAEKDPSDDLPRIDFSTFILSLSTTALYQMGLAPDPTTGNPIEPDLLLARQTIDTLEMLREKTRGNLGDEESKLIESVLYELHLRYVESQK